MDTIEHVNCSTPDLAEETRRKLLELVPECAGEGGEVDFDKLRQALSCEPIEGNVERYEFTWPGKRKARAGANTPISATLRPCRDESVDFDKTENLYIEGDNLEVLKLLQSAYAGKVKMIYIDPPYNTGHDFVYRDNFTLTQKEIEEAGDAADSLGNLYEINDSAEARYHSNWCSMMWPRLKLARNLLTDDGVIFISIDDNEVTNLRKICDEVFGETNFRNVIYVRRRTKSLNSQFAEQGLNSVNVGLECVLVYAKSEAFIMNALRKKKEDAPEKGRWDVFWSNADRPTMRYEILGFTPTSGQWRNSKEKADIAVANYKKFEDEFASKMTLEEYWKKTGIESFVRRIPDGQGKNGGVQHWVPPSDTMLRTSNWADIEVSEIGKEFDLPFDNPKNKNLLMELTKLVGGDSDSLILDFFSGSATTAHAVMQLNAEDGGNRKFIMVQLPEICDPDGEAAKAGYETICEIGKERIRRAGAKIKEENALTAPNLDVGFRVLYLDDSSLNDTSTTAGKATQEGLALQFSRIRADRTPEDLLFQLLLETRIPLSETIATGKVDGNDVFFVGLPSGTELPAEGAPLVACLDPQAKMDTQFFLDIAKLKPGLAFFRDDAFKDDSARTNLQQAFDQFSPSTGIKVL